MVCSFCERRALSGEHRGDVFICDDCSVYEIYQCVDCGLLVEGCDLGSLTAHDGPSFCPDCRSVDSFKYIWP